jgi:UDP-N-acetylmuramoyl-L-alanyl-D-glutamate--2,6-diaminopimelate ligase
MLDQRQSAAVMEVSSHALVQERVRGVRFAAAVITNFSQDHLDYHGTMEAYREAKLLLFRSLPPGSTAVIPADDQVGIRAREALGPGVHAVTFGISSQAEFSAKIRRSWLAGSDLELATPEGKVRLLLPLIGQHNVRNALAAAAAARALGVGSLAIALALERIKAARGRLEPVGAAPFHVLLDYAHTPDALLQVCRALRPMTRGRLLVLFGCGGNRDRTKRPLMGKAVASAADLAVITSDNPRSEDPEVILDEIEVGFREAGKTCRLLRQSDRAQAIRLILEEARAGDVVLLAGKGHETYQVLQDSVVPFDDRAVAEDVLCSR